MTDERPEATPPPAAGDTTAATPEEAAMQAVARPGTGAFDAATWTMGRHYLGAIEVEMGGVTTIDVVAEDFDDDYQEAGALAAVRDIASHARTPSDLAGPLEDVLAPDEHGPFNGEVVGPEEGRHAAEVRIRHEHPSDGEQ